MSSRLSVRESLAWASLLDHEPPDVARQARSLFQKAQTKLSAGSGHVLAGISGNDRALACLCVLLTKHSSRLTITERRAAETSLQRQSGVAPRIFANAAKQLTVLLAGSNEKALRKPEPPAEGSDGIRDTLDWGTLLDFEPPEVVSQARKIFKEIIVQSREPGHKIVGLDGNRRAVACLSLYLVKTTGEKLLRADAEKNLYRLSGVTPEVFSQATEQFRGLLGLASPSSVKRGTTSGQDSGRPNESAGKRKRDSITERDQTITELTRSSTAERPHLKRKLINLESDPTFSPTSSQLPRTDPSNHRAPVNVSEPPSPLKHLVSTRRTRTIEKPSLNLPLAQVPAQPMCIFESRLVLNPHRTPLPRVSTTEYDDWNWKSRVFHQNWNEADFCKRDDWVQRSIILK